MIYLVGHWNRVAGSAVYKEPFVSSAPGGTPLSGYAKRDWDVLEGKVGGKFALDPVTLQFELYAGKNTAPLIGEQAVFSYTANDIHEAGGWLQLGYNFTTSLSLWGLYGTSRSSVADVTAAGGGRFSNSVAGGMFQYKNGGFGLGPEFYFVQTKSTAAAGDGAPDGVMNGTQILMSGMYFF